MASISDLINAQMQKAGKPRTTTTTVTEPEEPLDLASLGLLLYFLLNKAKQKATPVTATLGLTGIPPARDMTGIQEQAPGSMPDQAYGMGNLTPQQLAQLILSGMMGGR